MTVYELSEQKHYLPVNTTARNTGALSGLQHGAAKMVDLFSIGDYLYDGRFSSDGMRCYWDDDDDDYGYGGSDDDEPGCGEGWTCSRCPNLGCPANERN